MPDWKGSRDDMKNQENTIEKYANNAGFQEVHLVPYSIRSESYEKPVDDFDSSLGPFLHETDSVLSQVSHWTWSLNTMNTGITELKNTLKTKDKQIISLVTDIGKLKKEIEKKEQKLKDMKTLLKSERERFDRYRRNTCIEVKTQKSEEVQDIVEQNHKSCKEMQKLNSEVILYKQLHWEQTHTVDRLSKQMKALKDDNVNLKGKLIAQEKSANKFILETAQRFDNSRKEMNLLMSKQIDSYSTQKKDIILWKIVERNTRLAHDNSMLKQELRTLKEQVIGNKNENNLSVFNSLFPSYLSLKISEESQKLNLSTTLARKKSSLNIGLSSHQMKFHFFDGKKDRVSAWQQFLDKKSSNNIIHWDCLTRTSDEGSQYMELVRTYSAPALHHTKPN